MPVKLGARPEHDFDQPLGLLSDCHRRIESFLSVLLRIAETMRGGSLTPPLREAIEASLRYFASAAPRHTEDEEHSLFPRMRNSQDPEVRAAMARIDALEADHRNADAAHADVNELAQKWLDDGAIGRSETARLIELLRSLQSLYQHHIEIEDHEIFPLAGRILSADEIATVGREMARRRGLERPPRDAAGPTGEGRNR